jgi:hypothetical protein
MPGRKNLKPEIRFNDRMLTANVKQNFGFAPG